MTRVRFAESSDIPALVELGRSIHVESRYGWMTYNAKRTWQWLEQVIGRKDHCLFVVERGPAELGGLLIGSALQYPFSNEFVGQVEMLYLEPALRGGMAASKLSTAFRQWALNRGCVEMLACNRYGAHEERARTLFTRLGMPAVGSVHATWLEGHMPL